MFARILETVSRLVVLLGSLFPGRENCSTCGALLPTRGRFCGACGAHAGGRWTRRVKRAAILAVWSSPGFILAAYVYTASSGSLEKVRSQTRALAGQNETLRSDVQRLRESPDLVKARDEAAALRERLKAADDKLVEMGTIKQQLAVAESAGKSSESRLSEATKQLNESRIELGTLRAQGQVPWVWKPPDNERGFPAPPVTQIAPTPILNACELAMVGKWKIDEPELERRFAPVFAKYFGVPATHPEIQTAVKKALPETLAQLGFSIEFKPDRVFICVGSLGGTPSIRGGTWTCSNGALTIYPPNPSGVWSYERPYVLMTTDAAPFGKLELPFKKEGT